MLSIGPLKRLHRAAGPSWLIVSVSTRVIVAGSATRPTIEISAISAGKIDRTE